MGDLVTISVLGVPDFKKELTYARRRFTDGTFVMTPARIYFNRVRQEFDTEGQGNWESLSDMRKKIRLNDGFPVAPILKTTGGLKKVATSWTSIGHVDYRGTTTEMTVSGSNSDKTWTIEGNKVYNNDGHDPYTKTGRRRKVGGVLVLGRRLPARPFWPMIDPHIADGMVKPAEDFVTNWVNGTPDRWSVNWNGANI